VRKKYRNILLSPYREILIFGVPTIIFIAIVVMSFVLEGSQQFSLLAQSFLHGQLSFRSSIGGLGQDPIFWHGKVYWGEGPFPAVLLMPLVGFFSLFHRFYFQGYLDWVLILGVSFFVFKLARSLKYSKEDSIVLTLGFVLGSAFIGVASVSSSWFFAQVVTTFLLFWSLYEYYVRSHKCWWLIGIICALILLTRVTATPVLLFFCLELWRLRRSIKQKLIKSIQLLLPTVFAIILWGLYNFLRFHNPFNGGYAHQLLYYDSAKARSYGEFSLIHVPAGLYSAIFGAPIRVLRDSGSWTLKFPYIQNNVYGMSIYITSPYLLSLFTHKWSSFEAKERNLLIAIFVSALFVFSYFGLGLIQFGYRYTLDFLPELFLLFMIMYRKNHTKLSNGMRTLLLGAGVFNFYLLLPLIL